MPGGCQDSDEWRDAERAAAGVTRAIYGEEVAQTSVDLASSTSDAEWHSAVRLELEGLASGLDAMLSAQPEEIQDVLDIFKGRRLTPRIRAIAWKRKMVTPAHIAAVVRKMERTRADPSGSAPLPSLIEELIRSAMQSTLNLYATTKQRKQRLVEAFGALYLLQESLAPQGVSACLVCTMAMSAEAIGSVAAIADAILKLQAQVSQL